MSDEISRRGLEAQANVDAARNQAAPERRVFASTLSPRPSALLFWLVQISRFGLAAMWLFAAGAKIYTSSDPEKSFFKNMTFLLGDRWGMPLAIAIISAEIIAAALLLWPRTTRLGGMFSAAMLIAFAGYALYYRYGLGNAEGLECGCFGGIIGSQLGVTTALRNLLLLIPAVLVIFGFPRVRRDRQPGLVEPQEATS